MACMCGDTRCGSCGPAQGNGQCPWCMKWADDDPPLNARGNAMVLTILFQDYCGRVGEKNCWCPLCQIGWRMSPCDDPAECERRIREQDEQEERLARDEQMTDAEYEAACRETEEDEHSAEEFWFPKS